MKYISITVTTFQDNPQINHGFFYYSDDDSNIELSHRLGYEEAMNELRKTEKLLGKAADLSVNTFSPTISYKEIHGSF